MSHGIWETRGRPQKPPPKEPQHPPGDKSCPAAGSGRPPRGPENGKGPGGAAHLPVGADDDFSEVVVHGRHGLADRVQGHVHLLLHPVAVGQELDHLHHHLQRGQSQRASTCSPQPNLPTPGLTSCPYSLQARRAGASCRAQGTLQRAATPAAGLTSNSPLVYLASGTLTISSSLASGTPCGGAGRFGELGACRANPPELPTSRGTGTHSAVPERQHGDDHGRGGPAPAAGAVEDEGCPRVLGQGGLHRLQQPVKVLPRGEARI